MEYKNLGRTGLKVSVACLGCGGSSALGRSKGKTEEHSINLVKAAIDLGINFFDTANVYGTEKIVGKAIKNINRDKVIISTKHHVATKDKQIGLKYIIAGLDNSLKELKTDYIDVFHLHGVAPKNYDFALKLVPKLLKEKEKGKFRFLGITESSPIDPEQITITKALDDQCFDVTMFALSIMNHNAKKNILPKSISQNIGTMIMFAVRSVFSIPGRLELDINRLVQNNELPNWFIKEKNPLEFILKDSGAKSIIDECYRYARHQEGVDTVLFGTSNLNHLNKNIKSILAPKLSAESIKKIEHYFRNLKGVGLDFPERK